MQNYLSVSCISKGGLILNVQLIRRKKNLVVRLKGELDHHTSSVFRQAVEKELEKEDMVQNLILNMEKLTFMDSSGIGVILGRYKQIKARGGQVIICGLKTHNKKILEMGGLLKIIPVSKDENNAMSNLG
jgi:stage II sporulation protein AA (anti-sigma F factor antagonist)